MNFFKDQGLSDGQIKDLIKGTGEELGNPIATAYDVLREKGFTQTGALTICLLACIRDPEEKSDEVN